MITNKQSKRFFCNYLSKSVLVACALLFLAGLTSPSAKASSLVLNGGFESTTLTSPGGYFCSNGPGGTCLSNVTNWTSVCRNGACGGGGTPTSLIFPGTGGSVFNSSIGLQSNAPNSPDGGNFVAADADAVYNSAISQQINGLTSGLNYTLTFYQASDQQKGNATPFQAQWQVTLGTSTQSSQIITNPGGAFTGWTQQSLTFKATAGSELLSFLAVSPSGAPPVALLDGVSLTAAPTPEVATSYLAFTAFALFAVYARFRQRRRA